MKTYKTKMREFQLKENKTDYQKVKITSAKEAYNALKPLFEEHMTIYESFYILFLNQANNTTGFVKISQGGIAGTVVDVKIIAKYCIETLSPAVILAHNHPSGQLKPSRQDIEITKKLVKALNFCDTKVLDHLIISENGYYSFAEERML